MAAAKLSPLEQDELADYIETLLPSARPATDLAALSNNNVERLKQLRRESLTRLIQMSEEMGLYDEE